MSDRVGQQFGNYTLVRLLGWGGFADVYLGQHIHLNTLVAIKVLHGQLPAEDVEQFLQEARTLVRLEHSHIIRVLDFGIEDDAPYLVMAYAPNGTVRQLYPKGSVLPLARIVSYTAQIASALQYLHDQKLIHRDIKPENLLLGAKHEILLSDFGTALLVQTVNMQGVQGLAGTVTYMAPEQLQGHPRAASDQYGLAVVVYEWLCGQAPFRGSFTELSTQHVLSPPPSLRAKNPAISTDVEQVVMTALAKEPQQRFGNIRAFAQALADAANLTPEALAAEDTEGESPSPAASTALLESGVLLTPPRGAPVAVDESANDETVRTSGNNGISAAALQETAPISGEARLPSSAAEQDTGEATVRIPTSALTAPAEPTKRALSRRALFVAGAGVLALAVVGGGVALARIVEKPHLTIPTHPASTPTVSPSQKLTLNVYHGHTNWINAISWSPDSTRIASGSADKTVQVWDALTGKNAVTYEHDNFVKAVAWSPNATYLASAGRDRVVEVQNAATGGIVYAYHRYYRWVNAVSWSPDSTLLASASDDKTARIWDATTGAHVLIYRGHTDMVNAVAFSPDGKLVASGDASGFIQVWDAKTGARISIYHAHTDQVRSLAWSRHGKDVLSASWDHTVQVWNAAKASHVLTYHQPSEVEAVTLSPDGVYAASGGNDKIAYVWKIATGQTVFAYTGHKQSIHSIAWSPGGQMLASGSMDTTVRVWKSPV
ncbi:MAG: serine/threonine-protein kinase [Ktedonobacteraceae bacterium]